MKESILTFTESVKRGVVRKVKGRTEDLHEERTRRRKQQIRKNF